MKKSISLFCFLFWFSTGSIWAQTGIGTMTPNSSALLDISSVTKGLLTPRMTTLQRNAIVNPATGLIVYNTSTSSFNYFDLGWKEFLDYAKYYASTATDTITTTITTPVIANQMTITPPLAGKYEVTFNGVFNNVPIVSTVNVEASESIPSTKAQQAKTDLQALINQLTALANTDVSHVPAFGNGETLLPGIYSIGGAASIAGTLTLNGAGNSNAIFVIKSGGALAAGAATNVILVNGAQAKNVFWLVNGAPSFGANSVMKGIVVASTTGAIAFNASSTLEGRLFTIYGAITFGPAVASMPAGVSPFPLGVLADFVLYTGSGGVTNTAESIITGNLGTNLGAFTGFESATVNGAFVTSDTYTSATTTVTTIISPNDTEILATFGIYQNGVLIPSSSKTLSSNAGASSVTLQAIASIAANQTVDVRWITNSGKLMMGNRAFTLIKVQ